MSNIDSSTEPDKKIAAVIDIGATSIRMAIAEIDAHGRVHTLESVAQPITLVDKPDAVPMQPGPGKITFDNLNVIGR